MHLKTKSVLSLLSATLLTAFSLFASPALAGQEVSQGNYTDASGAQHPWRVDGSHTLIWDEKPFVPVGGLFQARSWSPQATEQDFQSDVEALQILKRNGVTDIYLQPARGGITNIRPAAIQKLVDHLEAEGFTYGLSINDGPRELLTGYLVRPGAFRQETPEQGGIVRFPVTELMSSLYFVVSSNGADIFDKGKADMVAEGARVTVRSIPGKYVVFLLPQKVYFGTAGGGNSIGMPNLWDGFDTYRDALLAHLRQVKWGKGFRFFVDALPSNLNISSGDAEKLIPTGKGFVTEWADWLAHRYKTVDNLRTAWGLQSVEPQEFLTAARLLPLWGGGKGIQNFYDPETNEALKVETIRSNFWKDLADFKAESVRAYMNDLATVLKRGVADVPVVYRSRNFSPLFTGLPSKSGFDGIGIDAYGRGTDLVTTSAGYVYAQAADAPKTMWLPVTGTQETDSPTQKAAQGYASRFALHADLDWLREIGARGFYVDGVRIVDPARKNYNLSDIPEQVAWLADYQRMLVATGVAAAGTLPMAVFYPRDLPIITVRQISGGGWWLPTNRPYILYDFGTMGKAYSMTEPDGSVVYYMWNPAGPKTLKIKISKRAPDAPPITVSKYANSSMKGSTLTLTVGPDPVRIANLPQKMIPVPEGTFEEMVKEARFLLVTLKKQNVSDVIRFEPQLDGIERRVNKDNPITNIGEVQRMLFEMRDMMRPYAWLEAEGTPRTAVAHSFDEVGYRSGASNNQVLMVEPRPEGSPKALATYGINVREAGPYNLWVAASPGSALTFRLNGQPLLDENVVPQVVGKPYANGTLVWMRLGIATLPKGSLALEMRANGAAAVDAILLTRGEFTPDGITPPPINP
jgi:hypothetical protein